MPGSLWESYSSFCNTDGGVILLGVKEEGGSLLVEGVEDDAALVKSFWDIVQNPEADSTMTLRGLASKLGLSKTTITTAIATLIKRDLLRRVGPKKGGHWEIVSP